MKILIGTHAPLDLKLGAAQTATNLAEEFRQRGHEVQIWSPHPLPSGKFWQTLPAMRKKIDDFLQSNRGWDIVDLPPSLVTPFAVKNNFVVARNVQPDLEYLYSELFLPRRFRQFLTYPFHQWNTWNQVFHILKGMKRAHKNLILGRHNFEIACRKFPFLRGKAKPYCCAVHSADREPLRKIREQRKVLSGEPQRFLWIGRWVANKNPERLIKIIKKWSGASCRFTIAGCGSCGAESIRQLQLGKNVEVIPEYLRVEIPAILAAHDAGIFTSVVEGWGISLNEMLESGMPVYATDAGGVQDLKPIVKEMLQPISALENSSPQFSSASVDWDAYEKNFSWSAIAEQYLADVTPEKFRS